jgi:hypothetical protein
MTQARAEGAPWWNEGPFLYFGRMGANKGVPEIVRAWLGLAARLGTRCPDLWLAGGAPDEIAVIRRLCGNSALLDRLETRGRIRWWGYLDETGISALLLKARALLMHSAYEPGGRVVLEAMAQGVPVIATPQGFARDLVRDWVNGFLVPFGDLRLLRRRLEQFARQPLLGPSMSIAARATASAALHSWDFYRTHTDIYATTSSKSDPPTLKSFARNPDVIRDPLPQGLSGRYPFPPTVPDSASVLNAACALLDEPFDRCRVHELPPEQGALRWQVEADDRRWIAFHLYTIYARRVLWDRDYEGPLFVRGADRRRRLAKASQLPEFAPLLEDCLDGIQLREDLPAVSQGERKLDWLSTTLVPLQALWQHSPAKDEARELRATMADWSRGLGQSPWRDDGGQAKVLRKASLRAAWAETFDKLRRRSIEIPAGSKAAIIRLEPIATTYAAREEELVPLCMQHGNPGQGTARVGALGPCLVGGDRLHLGWWGRDAALLLNVCGKAGSAWLEQALIALCPAAERRPLVLLWAILQTVFDLAEARERDKGGHEPHLKSLLASLESITRLS